MSSFSFPEPLAGYRVHLVGAKGTGMCALAELLSHRGASVSGSDVEDRFYTDAILADMGIAVRPFSPDNVSLELDLVVHSAAYAPERHPELMRAAELGVRTLSYPEALGAFSRRRFSCGIAGVHGKTTTTALAGSLVKGMGIRATVLAGSAVTSFGGRSTLHNGDDFFIAETSEYRRHVLNFSPCLILLTDIGPEH